MSKVCGKCGKVKSLSCFNKDKYTKTGYRSQCKCCMKQQRIDLKDYYINWRNNPEKKAWYAKYRKDRYKKDKHKIKARNATRSLTRQPCEVCGEKKVHAHHDDYNKPSITINH